MTTRAFVTLACVAALSTALSACSSPPTRQQLGVGSGAVLGGVVGNVLTGGSTAGTIGGAAAGGIIGHEMTKPRR